MQQFFTITLLSDLCTSDGAPSDGFDVDCAFDSRGIPVIRGTRLKGLLREAGEELCTLGLAADADVARLFGTRMGGNVPGVPAALTVFDAHPADLADRRAAAAGKTPAQCRAEGTVVRVNASLDEAGVTDRIRTMRAVRRGTVFVCRCTLDDPALVPLFEDCLKLVRHIGIGRTRGMGEVRCAPLDVPPEPAAPPPVLPADTVRLRITIELRSPLLLSEDSEQIPGHTVAGMRARCGLDTDALREQGARFTDAAVALGDCPAWTPPACLAAPKRAVPDKDGRMPLYVLDTPACLALSEPAVALRGGHLAVDAAFSDPRFVRVRRTRLPRRERGPHGRTQGVTHEALAEGQRFIGYLYGPRPVLEAAAQLPRTFLTAGGRYRTGGLGECRIRLDAEGPQQPRPMTDLLAVWLLSPAVLFDENGMYAARPAVLREYLDLLLAPDGLRVTALDARWVRGCTVAGWRQSWGTPAWAHAAYAAGSVFLVRTSAPVDPRTLEGRAVGERTAEGFGTFRILPAETLGIVL